MKVSIVVVTYNRLDLVEKCLAAIAGAITKDNEVIVVDNNSTDDVVSFVKKKYPKFNIISNNKNLGFGGGNNLGMKVAKGDYLLLVNTDAFIDENTIPELVFFLEKNSKVGVVAPRLLNADRSIQPSGGFAPRLLQIFLIMTFIDNLPIVRKFVPSLHIRDKQFFGREQSVDWLMGACLLVRREVFEKTLGFDEKIFMYGEEVEWCYRIRKAGYEIRLDPKVSVIHLGHASSDSQNFGIIKEMESFISFYRKHEPRWQFFIMMGLVTLGCFLRMLRGVITLNKEMVVTYWRSLINFLEKV